jgi:hypothetical protein
MAAKPDTLAAGRKMIESMMAEAQKTPAEGKTGVPFEDKLKLLDRWIKFQALERSLKQGGMGKGFEDQGDDDEAGQF